MYVRVYLYISEESSRTSLSGLEVVITTRWSGPTNTTYRIVTTIQQRHHAMFDIGNPQMVCTAKYSITSDYATQFSDRHRILNV